MWWCAVVLCCLYASLSVPVVCFLPLRVCCACSGVSRCAFSVLSALCGAVLRCLVPLRCAVRVLCAVSGAWCCWFLRCLLLGVRWWLWLPDVVVWCCAPPSVPVSGLAVARRLPCGVLLPCVVSCGAVLPCGAVLWCPVVSFFFFFSLLVVLVFCFPFKISRKTRENGFLFLKIDSNYTLRNPRASSKTTFYSLTYVLPGGLHGVVVRSTPNSEL